MMSSNDLTRQDSGPIVPGPGTLFRQGTDPAMMSSNDLTRQDSGPIVPGPGTLFRQGTDPAMMSNNDLRTSNSPEVVMPGPGKLMRQGTDPEMDTNPASPKPPSAMKYALPDLRFPGRPMGLARAPPSPEPEIQPGPGTLFRQGTDPAMMSSNDL